MKSPTHQDRASRRRWLSLTLAVVVGATLLAAALWLCVAVLPQRLYPPLSDADLTGLSPADQAARHEGRDRLQNDVRTTLLQGLAALLVLGGAGMAPRSPCGRSVSAASSSSTPVSRPSAATTAPANNSSSPANRPSVATSVCVSRSPSPRKARSPPGSPALSTNSASPVRIGSTSAWAGSTPWNASRTTPQPTDWLWSRSSPRSSAATHRGRPACPANTTPMCLLTRCHRWRLARPT